MNLHTKSSRRRVVNFTAEEKALLSLLVKKQPIVESKLTDGNSVLRKQAAWESITMEFNGNANVHKRETITLKKAWDNMKAFTRRTRATHRGNMVKMATPAMMCEVQNSYDSDGLVLTDTDLIQHEATMRIKHLESKQNMEMQILQTQLEVEQIRKKAASLEEERNYILLEKAKIEIKNLEAIKREKPYD